jgi:hypothetical protein
MPGLRKPYQAGSNSLACVLQPDRYSTAMPSGIWVLGIWVAAACDGQRLPSSAPRLTLVWQTVRRLVRLKTGRQRTSAGNSVMQWSSLRGWCWRDRRARGSAQSSAWLRQKVASSLDGPTDNLPPLQTGGCASVARGQTPHCHYAPQSAWHRSRWPLHQPS